MLYFLCLSHRDLYKNIFLMALKKSSAFYGYFNTLKNLQVDIS